jgi:hypothetical protein
MSIRARNYINPKSRHWLCEIIQKYKFRIGAEIGSGKGRTAVFLLENNPCLKLIEIAWFPNEHINIRYTKKDGCPQGFRCSTGYIKRVFYENIDKFVSEGRVRIISKPSHKACDDIDNNSLDFVFIDADHSYEHTLEDIKCWYSKVRDYGLICGHDFTHPKCPGVEQAVNEYFGNDFELGINGIWYSWKN